MSEFLEALNTLDKVCVSSDYRHPLFLVVEGEPGMGKTRFLRAVIDAAGKNDMRSVPLQFMKLGLFIYSRANRIAHHFPASKTISGGNPFVYVIVK